MDTEAPLTNFSDCHSGIFKQLNVLGELPALLEPAARAREVAAQALDFFPSTIFEHHQDEERELFPAVLASARHGEERERVEGMTARLTDEHRELERLWAQLERGLKQVAKGQSSELDVQMLQRLVENYAAHARYEEQAFLPVSETILGRNGNHMAALGLSLHLRHVKVPTPYI